MIFLLGGGVWRIKFSPHNPNLVLTGCMHNGSAVYNIVPEESSILHDEHAGQDQSSYFYSVATKLLLHHPSTPGENMLAYGVDWAPQPPLENVHKYVSSSFYEKTLEIVAFGGNSDER